MHCERRWELLVRPVLEGYGGPMKKGKGVWGNPPPPGYMSHNDQPSGGSF